MRESLGPTAVYDALPPSAICSGVALFVSRGDDEPTLLTDVSSVSGGPSGIQFRCVGPDGRTYLAINSPQGCTFLEC